MRPLHLAVLAAATTIMLPAPAMAQGGEESKKVSKRERLAQHGYHKCKTWKCAVKTKHRRAQQLRRQLRNEMRDYKRNPMPWCTWGPESGSGRGEWSIARYRQPNVSGGSGGGKFQILLQTWFGYGGRAFASNPINAKPVHQERVARRVLSGQGLGAWVNC